MLSQNGLLTISSFRAIITIEVIFMSKTTLQISVDADVWEQFERLAAEENISPNDLLASILEQKANEQNINN